MIQKSGLVVAFEYRYKLDGKQRSAACGKWPTLSLKDIHKRRNTRQELVHTGKDPVELNKAAKLETQPVQTKSIENQKAELARLAVEAATLRTFGDAVAHWEKRELPKRKDGGKEAMQAINKDISRPWEESVKRAMMVNGWMLTP